MNNQNFLSDIEKQIEFLENKKLLINNKNDIKKYIENYGFSRLFLALSKSFENDKNKNYLPETNEYSFLNLFYFDNDFSNIFALYMGYFEYKLAANLVIQMNFECPQLDKQLERFLDKRKQKSTKTLIKNAYKDDPDSYLQDYVENEFYPAEIFINFLELGTKQYLIKDHFKQHNSKMPNNFNLENYQELVTMTDIIRKFRNNSNHYNKLIRFTVSIAEDQQNILEEIFRRNFNKNHTDDNPSELWKKIRTLFFDNENKINNSFLLALVLIIVLGTAQAENFLDDIKKFIANEMKKYDKKDETDEMGTFGVQKFLYGKKHYNWPKDGFEILTEIVEMKQKQILRFF